ncbi:phage terminase small subunit [Gemmiger sp.]
MPKARNAKAEEALALYRQGLKLVEIAKQLDLPEGTVRRWKCTYKWDGERSQPKKANARKEKKKSGGQPGNKNAVGNRGGPGAPYGNQRATRWGLLSKYIPKETMEIMNITADTSPLDLLWDQIQIAYVAIVRAQQISFVTDKDDMTTTKIKEGYSDTGGTEEWEVQQAWDKQANFMKAQARAQSELRSMIKQYDEMLHKDWDAATEEQKARLQLLQSKIEGGGTDEAPVVIINDTKRDADQ